RTAESDAQRQAIINALLALPGGRKKLEDMADDLERPLSKETGAAVRHALGYSEVPAWVWPNTNNEKHRKVLYKQALQTMSLYRYLELRGPNTDKATLF